jgi:hypothetical protein
MELAKMRSTLGAIPARRGVSLCLSKGFALIERFSEDLDLKLEPGLVALCQRPRPGRKLRQGRIHVSFGLEGAVSGRPFPMPMKRLLILGSLSVIVLLVSCSEEGDSTTAAAPTAGSSAASAGAGEPGSSGAPSTVEGGSNAGGSDSSSSPVGTSSGEGGAAGASDDTSGAAGAGDNSSGAAGAAGAGGGGPITGVGSPCTSDDDCGMGDCVLESAHPLYTGGYCTFRLCQADCPVGSQCRGGGGIASSGCFLECVDSVPCREGYLCCADPISPESGTRELCLPPGALGCH